jgi:hypothetical protein
MENDIYPMEHFFSLPVIYKDNELNLNARLVTFAYTYTFYVMLDTREVAIERDDEQHFRIIDESDTIDQTVDRGLVEAIIESLKQLK